MTVPADGRTDPGPRISLRLLGGFELWVEDQCVPLMPSSQRLLAYLAVHEGPVTRAALTTQLWPETTRRRAAACLRSALWRLVKPPHTLIQGRGPILDIAPDVGVDLAAVRRYTAEVTRPDPPGQDPAVPLTALTAELLPGWTEPWVNAERDWFRQRCLRALESLSHRFRTAGDHFHAHETALAAVRTDPLRESAHRRLIELHLADGNPAQAVRQYTSYRSHLRRELGLAPSPEIRQLIQPVLVGRLA
jgi:DNA-binding SARP family transcriptional activator